VERERGASHRAKKEALKCSWSRRRKVNHSEAKEEMQNWLHYSELKNKYVVN
jgi:hypothetical protein